MFRKNNSSGKPLPDSYNSFRSKSTYQKNFTKIDQIVKRTDIEKITQDPAQIEVITRTIIGIALIQIFGTDNVLKIDQEIHHTI